VNREIFLYKDVTKFLKKTDKITRIRLIAALNELTEIPPVGDIKPLEGTEDFLRARIGKYRIIFEIDGDSVLVRKIDSRGQVYKGGI
jgi:mRNA interferase RelE/StbE